MKPKFIVDHIDPKGNIHSILVYAKDDIRWGNKTFSSIKEARAYINALNR